MLKNSGQSATISFLRRSVVLLYIMYVNSSAAITTVYFFPGQGSDERVFSEIKPDTNFRIVHIRYPIPAKGTTLPVYAALIGKQIDTSSAYIFVGLSLGGMICTELADFFKPEKIIIISSAKCRKELPFRYRFQKKIPLNRIIPEGWYKWGALLLQPIVEPDRNKNKQVFKSMLKNKNPTYLKRTVNMIINWERQKYDNRIIHIHGTKDHTIPIKPVKVTYSIENGSHMMTLTRGAEINTLMGLILKSGT